MDTTAISTLAMDGEFLYLFAGRTGEVSGKLWRCQKSNCFSTLTSIAILDGYDLWLRLSANRLGWPGGMCDAPECTNRVSDWFEAWDESFGYRFDFERGSIYRCRLSDCSAGKTLVASSLAFQTVPRDVTLADERIYWVVAGEGIMRAPVDGSTPAERLTLGSVTEWSTVQLRQEFSSDVTVLDMALDGPFVYGALRVGNQNANQTLGCDTCKPGIAVARWQYSAAGRAREWILTGDADLADLVHMRVFGGEIVWGTATGNLWSCVADRCSISKRQIGIEDASSSFPPPWQFDSVAIDEQAIFWLSVPCQPIIFDCAPSGHRDWTLKRTPRIPQ